MSLFGKLILRDLSLMAGRPGEWLMPLLFFLLVALLLSLIFSKRMAEPLDEMAVASRKFAHGDFSVRVKNEGGRMDEVGTLIDSFNDMADNLEKSETHRQEFIANISHELRTPMTTIAGFADGILDGEEIWGLGYAGNPLSTDSDGDGIGDAADLFLNSADSDQDGDGILDEDDEDADNDGILNADETITNPLNPDSNNNGIPDGLEGISDTTPPVIVVIEPEDGVTL